MRSDDDRRLIALRADTLASTKEEAMNVIRSSPVDHRREQQAVTRRYDRVARIYDLIDAPMEIMGGQARRRRLVAQASGDVLEVGVGTGANLVHYPAEVSLTAIDASPQMLERAKQRVQRLGLTGHFELADVASLPFDDRRFDTTVSTCVFCSVSDPVAGLRELGRVTKPDGRILLLEHVRPRNRILGWLADLLTPITRRLIGFRLDRRTEENARRAGLTLERVRRDGIWREIVAKPTSAGTDTA